MSIRRAKQTDPSAVLIRLVVIVRSISFDLKKSVNRAATVPVKNVRAQGNASNNPLCGIEKIKEQYLKWINFRVTNNSRGFEFAGLIFAVLTKN